MKNLIKNQKGSVLVLTAVAMVVILGFATLAIDGGNLYYRHMKLQDIADACSLAACQELAETTKTDDVAKKNDAIAKAVDYAELNGIEVESVVKNGNVAEGTVKYGDEAGTMKIEFVGNNKVKVDVDIDTKLYFARVMGFNSSQVATASTAEFGVAQQQQSGIFPMAIWGGASNENGDDIVLSFMTPSSGNFGFLNFNHKPKLNKQSWKDTLDVGFTEPLSVGQVIYTEPGNDLKAVVDAFTPDGRFGSDCDCTYDDYEEGCPRVITIVSVAERFDAGSGRHEVTITGFVKVFIDSVIPGKGKVKDQLKAIYLEKVDLTSSLGDGDAEGKIKAVRLVE